MNSSSVIIICAVDASQNANRQPFQCDNLNVKIYRRIAQYMCYSSHAHKYTNICCNPLLNARECSAQFECGIIHAFRCIQYRMVCECIHAPVYVYACRAICRRAMIGGNSDYGMEATPHIYICASTI